MDFSQNCQKLINSDQFCPKSIKNGPKNDKITVFVIFDGFWQFWPFFQIWVKNATNPL